MYYQTIQILVCCCLLLLSCRKPADCEKPVGLHGNWIWVKSIGGFGGWTETPSSEGFTKRLEIDDFKFRAYVNDSLAFESDYNLEISAEVLLGTEEKTYIDFKAGDQQAILIGSSELTLIDQCYDCFTHTYERQ